MGTEFNNEIEILKKDQTKTIPEMKFSIRQIEVLESHCGKSHPLDGSYKIEYHNLKTK